MQGSGLTITLIIVIVTCLISYRAFNDGYFKGKLLHRPYLEHHNKEYYRLLTHGFIHANWVHLLINMFVLWMFGEYIERVFISLFGTMKGRLFFILMYILTIIAASIPTHLKHKDNSYYAALGASGATSGVVFAFVLFNPWENLYIYGLLPIPAIIAAILYLAYSSWASKNSRDNIGHDAHLYGAIFGFLFTIALKPSLFLSFLTKVIHEAPF